MNKIFQFLRNNKKKNSEDRKRLFLIGIPHFDWKIIELMKNDERFENIIKLIQESSYGEIIPQETLCSTPVEFTSIITGVGKKKHRVGYGEYSDREYIDKGRLYTRLDIKTKTIWEMALDHKKRVGLYQWLLTWPPKKINGFMVTGRASQGENKTYPRKLKEILWLDYPSEPDFLDPDAAMMLIKTYDIDFFLGMEERTHGPIHIFWECVEKSDDESLRKMREEFLNYFKPLNKFIGKLMEEFPKANIILVSDSGNRLREYPIYTLGNETIELSKKLGIDLQFYATDIYPPHLPKAKPTFHLSRKSQKEKERLTNVLNNIKYKNGENFIKDASWDGDNISFSFNFHPDFIGDKCNWINLVLPDGEDFKIWVIRQTGASYPKGGVFIARGPLIKKNHNLGEVDILSIAPTLLNLLEIPIPKDIDGKILEEMMINDA